LEKASPPVVNLTAGGSFLPNPQNKENTPTPIALLEDTILMASFQPFQNTRHAPTHLNNQDKHTYRGICIHSARPLILPITYLHYPGFAKRPPLKPA
jgi:hypothetical protein